MALGGYKFAGKYCQKGSLTDAEWILLSHKTKVAAFMAANTAANAGWDYYMDGSPDGNYHCIDEWTQAGNNYVTCFYNSRTGTYFALYTINTKRNSSSSITAGAVRMTLPIYTYSSSTSYYLGVYSSHLASIGTVPIAYNRDLRTDTAFITTLMPASAPAVGTSFSSTSTYTGNSFTNGSITTYYGFALKDDNIIAFSGNSVSDLFCSVFSGHAFSNFINSNDPDGCLVWNMQSLSSTAADNYELYTPYRAWGTNGCCCEGFICQNRLGTTISPKNCMIGALPLSEYDGGTMTSYPYQSLCVYDIYNNETFVRGKGMIDVSFLAINFSVTGTAPANAYQVVANGNYLCLRNCVNSTSSQSQYLVASSMNGTSQKVYYSFAFYCGWDPSNPIITDASAWTEYTGT